MFNLYADWGVDFVKVDDIAASRLYHFHKGEIELIRRAIDQCGREVVLSLSPGPAPLEYAEVLKVNANMWRMTDDYWDHWELLKDMFERCGKWNVHTGPGHWPDCDMLPLGHIGICSVNGGGGDCWTRFTKEEQVTMMTSWSIFHSPLMFGGELRDNDQWTLSLLTNKEVLHVNQHSHTNRLIYRNEDKIVWTAKDDDCNTFVALFNIGESEFEVGFIWSQLGLHSEKRVKDIWSGIDNGRFNHEYRQIIPPHGSILLRLY